MVDVIYVYANPYDGTVTLTKEELQELLDKAFKQGYYSRGYTYSSPWTTVTTTPYCTTTTGSNITVNPCTITCNNTAPSTLTADTGTQEDFSTYTKSMQDSIIFTASESNAQYGIGTNANA